MPRAFTPDERERIHERLISSARREVIHSGFRRTTVASLCRAAGISKGAFYQFFPSKELLIMKLCAHAERELRAQLDALVGDAGITPELRLRGVLDLLFEAVTHHPMMRALGDPEEMAWLLRAMPEGMLREAQLDDERYFGELAARLQRCGSIREDVDLLAFTGVPIAALAIAQQRELIGEERYPKLVALVVDGLVRTLERSP